VFRPEPPGEDEIRRILHAGLLAPFAAATTGSSGDYFRRFFVMRNGSESMKAAASLALKEAEKMAGELELAMKSDPSLRAKATGFARMLSRFLDTGAVPGIGTAPYYIVVAERRGFPPAEAQSLAHCLENMWLKATALCLGFQIVSITSRLSDNRQFCAMLGLVTGEWELMGCAAGYMADELSPSIRPPVEDVTVWLP
jgi:nitroreductase